MRLELWGVEGMPQVVAGDDLAALVAEAVASGEQPALADGDVVVVTSKIVSKAEGRVMVATDREAAIDAETVEVVARRGPMRIVRDRRGLVMAAAGVDASNAEAGTVLLLPVDPDASARRIRDGLRARLGVTVAVVVSDTFGRPWRHGLTDVAIGVAGMAAVVDLRGRPDTSGVPLEVTEIAVADEVAAAADLVKGKLAGVPVAVVRGLVLPPDDGRGSAPLVRPLEADLFRLGTAEAHEAGRQAARAEAFEAGRLPLRPEQRSPERL